MRYLPSLAAFAALISFALVFTETPTGPRPTRSAPAAGRAPARVRGHHPPFGGGERPLGRPMDAV